MSRIRSGFLCLSGSPHQPSTAIHSSSAVRLKPAPARLRGRVTFHPCSQRYNRQFGWQHDGMQG